MNYLEKYEELKERYFDILLADRLLDHYFYCYIDKIARPYKDHCVRVAMKYWEHLSLDGIVAALLHDIVEDADLGLKSLRSMKFSERSIWLIDKLTRKNGVSYQNYKYSIYNENDLELFIIKLADVIDNSNPKRLAKINKKESDYLENKYFDVRNNLCILIRQLSPEWRFNLEPLDFDLKIEYK